MSATVGMTDSRAENPSSGAAAPTSRARLGAAVIFFAVATLATQVILRRELAPGEFGTMNALFGLLIVLLAPFGALSAVLRRTLSTADYAPLLGCAALVWGLLCLVFLFLFLPVMRLPRDSLQFFAVLAVAGGLLAICARPLLPARWCIAIGILAVAVRFAVSGWAAGVWPVAESGLGGLILAFLVAGIAALREQSAAPPFAAAWSILKPRLVPALATISVVLAIALFTNADRLAAQREFGSPNPDEPSVMIQLQSAGQQHAGETVYVVDYARFDDYQAAGLVMRYLLWSLIPVLILWHAQRATLTRTTLRSLRFFGLYAGTLLAGVVFLLFAAPLLAHEFFAPSYPRFEKIDQMDLDLIGMTSAFVALGLVQALAVFALASRRHVECFALAGCSVAYALVLLCAARQPSLMISCMFGGALISLMLVMFIGVVRYARSHP